MKYFKYVAPPVALLVVALVLLYNVMLIGAPVPTGVWKAVDEDYYVVFKSDGTYVESTFNLPREYKYNESSMSYFDIAGEAHTTSLRTNYRGRMTMTLCGETYVLEKTDETPKLSSWSEGMTGNPLSAYKLVNDFPDFFYIRLFDDFVYRSVCGEQETIGKYIITSDRYLYLLSKDNTILMQWVPWSQGYAAFEMESNLTATGGLESDVVTSSSIVLEGKAKTKDGGITYTFSEDGTVTVDMGDQHEYLYNYTATAEGLIMLKDTTGACTEDALYRDPDTGVLYRYVIATDGWFDYLSQ